MGGSSSSDLVILLSMIFSIVALIALVAAVAVRRMEHRFEREWNEYLDRSYEGWRTDDES